LSSEVNELQDILVVRHIIHLVLTVLLPFEHGIRIELQFYHRCDKGAVGLALHRLEGTKVLLKSVMKTS
jgi:hypothetical protein